MKEREITRAGSFAIVALVYALAIVAGIACVLVCSYLTQTPVLQGFWWKLLVADILATVVTFAFSVAFKNASVYDPYWSVQHRHFARDNSLGERFRARRLGGCRRMPLGGAPHGELGVYLSRSFASRLALHQTARPNGKMVSLRQFFRNPPRADARRIRMHPSRRRGIVVCARIFRF